MGRFGTGQAIRRTEDQRFITGTGRYTDDLTFDGQLYLYFLRSPYPHGDITVLDVAAARASDGVAAVYTAEDLAAAGVRDVVGSGMPESSRTEGRPARQQPPLARGRVRYVGEPIAGIVAGSLAQAKDAAELIEFDVTELEPMVTVRESLRDGATVIHDEVPANRFGILEHGDREATERAFALAAHTVSLEVINNRLAPTAMEPRGCIAVWERGKMTLYQGCQGVHTLRDRILKSIELDALHVVSPDVGGAFGLKFFLQCETVVAVHAAKMLERPVKWTADRTESFLSDIHGRDHVTRAELAMDDDGRFGALRVSVTGNIGAYCGQAGPVIPWFGASMATGCYDIPVAYVDVTMAFTNTVPVDAYRGAGRPEAAYLVERLVDKAARSLGLAPDELRRRNFIRAGQFPYRTATQRLYDSGDYERLMDAAMARADWRDFEERRQKSAGAGKLRGIGLAYYVEICSAFGGEDTHVSFGRDGRVTVLVGTQSTGQGHETSFAQMVAGGLGIDMSNIDVVQGDSDRIPTGEGTAGSRTMAIAGSSLYRTVDSLLEDGRKMAAEVLEAAEADLEFEAGAFHIAGTDRSATLADVAAASFDDAARPDGVSPGLASSARFAVKDGTFPNGCHICEVEIDPATGEIEILRYTVEDDVGTVINPLILEGQIVGGVVQGLGQALCEHAVYDGDSGQLLSATFMDYTMPRADWVPDVGFRYQEVPSPSNPLGVKGAGEAGTVGAAPALVNAVIDAVADRGIDHVDMPLTPHKIWRLLHNSGSES